MKPYQDQTYYELLEVPATASENEIRAAYEKAAELYAPDSVAIYALENPDQVDELRARLREAMEILTDSDLREEYDRMIGVVRRPKGTLERVEPEPPREPSVVAATEVLPVPQSLHSTHPEFSLSYLPEPGKLEPPPPRNEQDSAPVREAMPFVPAAAEVRAAEPVRPPEPPRAAEPVRPPELPRAAEAARAPEPARATQATRAPEPTRSSGLPRSSIRSRGSEAPQLAEESAIATAEAAMAQVSAKAREPKPKPVEIPPDAEFNGELLRRVRESRGMSIVQVAERTRISARHLENVEADRYKDLPVAVYLRGILMNLAREYGLDAIRVSKSYLALAVKKS